MMMMMKDKFYTRHYLLIILFWVRVPVMVDPLAQEINTVEERHQDQNCLF
jgi:hypothetical protein